MKVVRYPSDVIDDSVVYSHNSLYELL